MCGKGDLGFRGLALEKFVRLRWIDTCGKGKGNLQ